MRFAILAITALAVVALLPSCIVTGTVEYTDPESGATASLGVNREFTPKTRPRKPTSEHKAVKPIER